MPPVTPQATSQEGCTRPTDAKSDEEKRIQPEDRYKNAGEDTLTHIRVRNRRKRYLDLHPEYFGPSLELAGLSPPFCPSMDAPACPQRGVQPRSSPSFLAQGANPMRSLLEGAR